MSEIKGYVVRGKGETGAALVAYGRSQDLRAWPGKPTMYPSLDEAAGARAAPDMRWCADVRIFSVAPDGTETPLPTYEEALKDIDGANIFLAAVGRPADGRGLVLRLADALGDAGDKIREAHAEVERLQAAAEDSRRLGEIQVLAEELDAVLRGSMAGDALDLVSRISALTLPAGAKAEGSAS